MKNVNILFIVFLFTIFYIAIIWITNNIIITETFYFASLEKLMSLKKIEDLIKFNKKTEWVAYVLLPIFNIIKYFLVSVVIFIGINLFELNITFKNCFKIVLFAEIIQIISIIIKTLYFYIYPPSTFEALQNFNPLGLTNFIKNGSIPKYLLYSIHQLNLFEFGYWLLLAYGIKAIGDIDFKNALKIIILSYGVGLFIWCIFITLLQLQFR